MIKRYLFFVQQPYSFAILRPLQTEILSRGDEVVWYLNGKNVSINSLNNDEKYLTSVEEVKSYNPIAVFVPGNIVPDFFPGIKVQVFHGLEYKKQGHFVIRDFYDLYCTHGPLTTIPFDKLKEIHKHFEVIETGWPKLDPYVKNYQKVNNSKPVLLYAPTFSPSLTSALDLIEEIKQLALTNDYLIKVKFHPKMKQGWIKLYSEFKHDNFEICDADNIVPLIQEADVVISDTSSVVDESLIIGKCVITYKNSQPQACLLNFDKPENLTKMVKQALNLTPIQTQSIQDYVSQVHPYQDGNSSIRILEAVDKVISQGVKKKPLNLVRKYKIRKALNYFYLK
ncbi:CDP-glycerol--glycerophosphate glycerophosphotransferase [Pseudoalteromonas sp. NBT06-2]|uniref:CDP-glycerol glycerophosphotransferase family protein n=1 Tax=Pseudoalteromonas sp. NBT06-2 TaxID=2025950 RepID=UPI000BA6C3FF|nr:CDP-glycerol glycerophosphotransferase family protein [Pseudoalteromonas sp. NBT06-2]PAJ75638.1 CDP-glycerol--glycerophosphate glycerophosphotransferase [Pseudoalteromonas sp. NBT06-2]